MNSTALDSWSFVCILAAGVIYVGAFFGYIADIASRAGTEHRDAGKALRIATALTWVGLGVHGVGVLMRGLSVGAVPWANMYEFSITATFLIVLVFALVSLKVNVRFLGALITGFVILALLVASIFFYVPGKTLPPALQSYWIVIHVLVAMLATAFYALGAGLAVLQLVTARRERAAADTEHGAEAVVAEAAVAPVASGRSAGAGGLAAETPAKGGQSPIAPTAGPTEDAPDTGARSARTSRWGRLLASLPSSETLETLSYRVNIVGFILWTFTLIFGAIWAQHAWGRYWNWDVKEVWTFVIWVLYAGYLHARATRGWRGDRAAWLAIAGFTAVIFNFTIVNIFFKGLHAYSGL